MIAQYKCQINSFIHHFIPTITMQAQYNGLGTTMDSQTLISVLKNPNVVKKMLEFFRGNSREITLQDIIIKEITKVSILKENRSIDDFV
jgi:hypothetical protein